MTAEKAWGYFCRLNILLSKWTLPYVSMQDDCSMEIQKMFCSEILSHTRGTPVAGFLGVKMTIAYPGIPHNIFKVKYADHATVVYLE